MKQQKITITYLVINHVRVLVQMEGNWRVMFTRRGHRVKGGGETVMVRSGM